jgi:hypothetical protein
MEFPRRTKAHITETAPWKLLQELAPRQWIGREVSERDYRSAFPARVARLTVTAKRGIEKTNQCHSE